MHERKREVETEHAWLECTGRLVVQRWKPGIALDARTIRETMRVRDEFFGDEPYVMIVVVPSGCEFSMTFLEQDQYAHTHADEAIIAMANVVEDADMRAIVSLYYAQHPPRYAFTVVASMPLALAWARPYVEGGK
jgi:hypothetical protein